MKEWLLDFKWTKEGFEAQVNDEVQQLLDKHRYMGISVRDRQALQFFTDEQAEELNEKLAGMCADGGHPHARHAARLIFSQMNEVDLRDGEPLMIPHPLAAFIEMDERKVGMGLLTEDEGIVLLRNSEFEF